MLDPHTGEPFQHMGRRRHRSKVGGGVGGRTLRLDMVGRLVGRSRSDLEARKDIGKRWLGWRTRQPTFSRSGWEIGRWKRNDIPGDVV